MKLLKVLTPLLIALSWAVFVVGYYGSYISAVENFLASSHLSSGDLSREIELARQKWIERGVAAYQVEVRIETRDDERWHTQIVLMWVKDGSIVEHSARCAPSMGPNCQPKPYHPEDFTIEGLFHRAASLAAQARGDQLAVRFDPAFQFPNSIQFDDPETGGEEFFLRVVSFKVLD